MTRGEFLLQRLKDECGMYKVLTIVCGISVIACVVMAVAAFIIGKLDGTIVFCTWVVFFVGYYRFTKSRWDGLAEALDEVGNDPVGIVERHDMSGSTALTIVELERPLKEYRQLSIAYGICAVMMLVLGTFLLVITISDHEVALSAVASLMVVWGVWLSVLTYQAIRNLRAAKQLGSLSEPREP